MDAFFSRTCCPDGARHCRDGPSHSRCPRRGETNVNENTPSCGSGRNATAPGRMTRPPSRNLSCTGAPLNTALKVSEIGPAANTVSWLMLPSEQPSCPTTHPPEGIGRFAHLPEVVYAVLFLPVRQAI